MRIRTFNPGAPQFPVDFADFAKIRRNDMQHALKISKRAVIGLASTYFSFGDSLVILVFMGIVHIEMNSFCTDVLERRAVTHLPI